jgi:plastocyanin
VTRCAILFALLAIGVIACGAPQAGATAAPAPTSATSEAPQYTTVESSTQPAGSILVQLSSYAFTPSEIPIGAGKVVFYLVNTSKEAHSMILRNPAVSILAVVAASANVEGGHSAVFTIDKLPAAVYRVSCAVQGAGHGDMTGTVTVR